MLYIVLLLVAFFVGRTYMKARSRVHHVHKIQAIRDLAALEKSGNLEEASYPSWASNNNRLEEFVAGVTALAKSRKIPKSFILTILDGPNNKHKLLILAGMMEKKGRSFNEQGMAASELILNHWSKTPDSEKQLFINGK